jgi:hypothetical protein
MNQAPSPNRQLKLEDLEQPVHPLEPRRSARTAARSPSSDEAFDQLNNECFDQLNNECFDQLNNECFDQLNNECST